MTADPITRFLIAFTVLFVIQALGIQLSTKYGSARAYFIISTVIGGIAGIGVLMMVSV